MPNFRPRHGFSVLAAFLLLGAASTARAQQVARYNHSMSMMVDGNTLIAGGRDAANATLATVSVYISTGAKFEFRASMNSPRSSHTATVLPDGTVLVTGGVNAAGTILDTGEVFNPRLNSWTTIPNTNFGGPRVNHTATLLPNGKVLIAGGQTNAGGTVLTGCSLYSAGAFTACGSNGAMQMGRAAHTATLLHNGRVFVAGGYRDPGNGFSGTTEVYDPVLDAWTAGPALIQARAWHTATQMGNQRVLIAGGNNEVNFLQSLGYMESTEIYDPNAHTIAPAAPLVGRKMYHSALLSGTGTVDLHGGLGNITTSYFNGPFPYLAGSRMAVTALSLTRGTVNSAATSNLFVSVSNSLSAGVSGTIVDGDINFSSPVTHGTDFEVDFNYPDLTQGSLDGVAVNSGSLSTTPELDPVSGFVQFIPQTVASKDINPIGATSTATTSGQPAQGVSTVLTGGTLHGVIHVPMIASNLGGTVVSGDATITAGAINKPSNNFPGGEGFDVALTGGNGSITGGTVALDSDGVPALIMNVTFTGLTGTITSSTNVPIGPAYSLAGLKATGITVRIRYVVSPIVMDGLQLEVDIATVAVRHMVYSDHASYEPKSNTWSFGQAGFPTFNHTSLVLPNADMFRYGGRTCQNSADCTAFTYTSLPTRGATILVHEGVNPWTTVGSLATPRSNHTLTVLPDGRVLAAGGEDASNTVGKSELFLPLEKTWSPAAEMKQRRSHHTATLLPNGNVLIAGGFTALNHSTGTSRHAEIFYPDTAAWVETTSMLSSRAYHAAVLLPDGNPFFVGGFANGTYLSSTEVFISTAHKWLSGPPLPEGRAQFTATTLHDGRTLVVGGINAVSGVLATTRIFNPATWSWSVGPNLNQGRHSHTANLLRDGRVIVVGGSDAVRERGLAEIYDPALNAWTRTTDSPVNGNDLGAGRLGHTATLLPDGKILFVGGFTAFGGPILHSEGFDVDFSTFQMQGPTGEARGDHATVLLRDGFLLSAGGFTGLTYSGRSEILYAGAYPDVATLAGGQRRRPTISQMVPTLVGVGSPITVRGTSFKGMTEASGGGGGSANSHHTHPRVYLQRADSASSSANDSGWMIDLSSGMYVSGVNSWANMDSSLTFHVPYTSATIPLGWYHLRVAANDQFSESATFQVGPPRPAGGPGVPTGLAVGPSSVVWTWAAAPGVFDGYSVYSATNGVFIATVPRSGGGTDNYLQTGLGPDTSALIKVAAYNITGDGSVAVATIPILTNISLVNGIAGLAQSPGSILWSWNPVGAATSYNVFSASTGVRIATPTLQFFTQTGLSTNSAYGIAVQAVLPGGDGFLSNPATAYTLAADPTPGFPGIHIVSTGSFVGQWLANTNPSGTKYHVKGVDGPSATVVHISSIVAENLGLPDLAPNTLYSLSVAAVNGDGVYTSFVSLGSTYTFARPPLNPTVLAADPSGISLSWGPNSNPGNTAYQVLYSSDAFATDVSTFIAFAAAYTTAAANIQNLITGRTYSVRIAARNAFGHETATVSTAAFTDNGGGPPGSLVLFAPTTAFATLSGTLGSSRRFEIRIPAGTFDQDTRIFVTSRAIGDLNCGNIPVGFSITNIPAVQPRLPVEVGIQYALTDTGLGSLTTLGMVRYDPVSGACVPMEARVDAANSIVYARLNHFSDFQLQQLVPGAAANTARVFPNPLYTRTQGFFTFDHIPAGAHVRVFTIHGEEVFDQAANASGIVTWRAQNKVGRPVASGLYLAVIESGGEKKIMKLAVVR